MTERVWRISADVACVLSPDGGRVAVLHLEAEVPVILVGTAASVWSALDGARTETELIEDLARNYGTDASVIHDDVIGLIDSLSTGGMITRAPRDKTAS